MLPLIRHRWLECLVAISMIAAPLALLLPEGAFDFDPDNTVSIASLLPQCVQQSDGNRIQIVLTSAKRLPSGDSRLTCVLLNASNVPVYYAGYRPYSFQRRLAHGWICPLYRRRVNVGPSWQDEEIGGCGNGVASMQLQPGQAGQFTAWQRASEPSIQIGVPWSLNRSSAFNDENVVWSGVITAQ